jgi:hypothetical protein
MLEQTVIETCSAVDPDWIRIQWCPWIRIRIRINNPDPDPGGKILLTKIEKS